MHNTHSQSELLENKFYKMLLLVEIIDTEIEIFNFIDY